MAQRRSLFLFLFLAILLSLLAIAHGGKDYYKVLGVDKTASERDIKKAFHRQSMKYHPDKNPSKSAEAKFQELSNAYDILSDTEKRKQYDMYGEDGLKGGGGPSGHPGGFQGSGFPGGGHQFNFHSGGGIPFEEAFGGGSGRRQFQFSFGQGGISFSGFENLFSGFGGNQEAQSGHDSDQSGHDSWSSLKGLDTLGSGSFVDKVLKAVEPWLVIFTDVNPSGAAAVKSEVEQAVKELKGLLKVGVVKCQEEKSLCKKYGNVRISPVLFPWGTTDKAKPVYYKGQLSKSALLKWCYAQLPNRSTKLSSSNFEKHLSKASEFPRAILFTDKDATPAVWRSVSSAFHEAVKLFEVQVTGNPSENSIATKYGVSKVPTVLGISSSGQQVRFAGKTTLESLYNWLENLERMNTGLANVPLLTKRTQSHTCGPDTPLCVIAVVPNWEAVEEPSKILQEVSQKSLLRRELGGTPVISYSIVDLSKQKSFLRAFPVVKEPRKSEVVLLAYKPKRKKFAIHDGFFNLEGAEQFVSGILDSAFSLQSVKHDPILS